MPSDAAGRDTRVFMSWLMAAGTRASGSSVPIGGAITGTEVLELGSTVSPATPSAARAS